MMMNTRRNASICRWMLAPLLLAGLVLSGCGDKNKEVKLPKEEERKPAVATGPEVDPRFRENYLARFAEVNLQEWELRGGEFCSQPLKSWANLQGISRRFVEKDFGTMAKFNPSFADAPAHKLVGWYMAVPNREDVRWVIPSMDEFLTLFSNEAGERIKFPSKKPLVAYVVKRIDMGGNRRVKHALRFEFKVDAGLEVRSRVDEEATMEGIEKAGYWDQPKGIVVRYFPAMGFKKNATDREDLGVYALYWSSTRKDNKFSWCLYASPEDITISYAKEWWRLALRPFARDHKE